MTEELSPPPKDVANGPEGLRIPKRAADAPLRPIVVTRMRSAMGDETLYILDDDDFGPSLTLPDGNLGEAERLLARGDVEGARAFVDQADGESSESWKRSLLARAALMEGEVVLAQTLLDGIRDEAALAATDAILALTEGNVTRAEKRAQEALNAAPDSVVPHYASALVKVATGVLDEARVTLEDVARSLPDHAVARHQLGQLVLAAGDAARAGTLFEMAIVLSPDFVPPAISLAEMLVEARQLGEAMNILTGITERRPTLLSPRLLQMRILLSVGELDGARQLIDALDEAAPNVADVSLLWAEVRARSGFLDDALARLEGLASGTDDGVAERALRLMAQLDLGREPPDHVSALEKLERAVQKNAFSADLRLEIAQVYFARGKTDDARGHLEALLAIPNLDLGVLLSGAVLAANHGAFRSARALAENAKSRVSGTAAERQIDGFLEQMPLIG